MKARTISPAWLAVPLLLHPASSGNAVVFTVRTVTFSRVTPGAEPLTTTRQNCNGNTHQTLQKK